jgi:hypothetical protein
MGNAPSRVQPFQNFDANVSGIAANRNVIDSTISLRKGCSATRRQRALDSSVLSVVLSPRLMSLFHYLPSMPATNSFLWRLNRLSNYLDNKYFKLSIARAFSFAFYY